VKLRMVAAQAKESSHRLWPTDPLTKVSVLLTELEGSNLSTTRQRLRNILLGALGRVAGGFMGQLVHRHGQMSVWVFVSAVAAGGLSGLFGPVRREPEIYWSGLLEWSFASSHAGYPRN
jgi:hypothetical protein